jgi:hypothetical protein
MRYSVKEHTHPQYGLVIEIAPSQEGDVSTYQAVSAAKHLYHYRGINRALPRFLVDGQIMPLHHLDRWAIETYQGIPKCEECCLPLEQVHSHSLANGLFFCSTKCSDANYHREMQHQADYEECDL